jgi:predicted XRE-type DNA-binding protein
MRISKQAKKMAEDLGLSEADAVVMDLKSRLYEHAAQAIKKSRRSHDVIAKKVGTSRARITRISNMGENSISIELLVKIIVALENKVPIRLTAA